MVARFGRALGEHFFLEILRPQGFLFELRDYAVDMRQKAVRRSGLGEVAQHAVTLGPAHGLLEQETLFERWDQRQVVSRAAQQFPREILEGLNARAEPSRYAGRAERGFR